MAERGESGELARWILEGIGDGVCVLDAERRVLLWNPALGRVTGIPAEEALGRPIGEVLPELRRSAAWGALERALAGEPVVLAPWAYEARRTGARGYARLEMTPLAGTPALVLVSFRDITALAESRKRLETANTLLEAILQSAPVAIIALDRQRAITFWNPGAERIFGWTAEEVAGRTLPCLDAESLDEHRRLLREAVQSGSPVEAEVVRRRKDGSRVEVSLSVQAVRRQDGVHTGYTVIYQDISERKQAERELRKSEARLERAQEIARMGTYEAVFSCWPPADDGHSIWSPGMYEILDLDAGTVTPGVAALLGRTHPEDRPRIVEAMRWPLEPGREKAALEHRVVLPDGEVRVVRQQVELTQAPDGSVQVVGAMQDITEYRRLEEQLLQSQKLEGIGQLAGGIAHDFNNLLTVINGYADLLARDEELAEGGRESAAAILSAGRRAAELTQQLLAFSRRQILQPKALNLNGVLKELRRMLDRLLGAHIEVVERLEPQLGLVYADAGQLQQVLLNIIVNARDAMPAGGRLSIATSNVEIGDQYLATHPPVVAGPYVCLEIGDTGAGMDEKTKARIFEPFFTTKELGRGTGLGLATVYGIVKQSHGFIWVYSEPGRGSSFKVYLPRMANQEPVAASDEAEGQGPAEAAGTVLLVEDQGHVRLFAAQVLRRQGYRVLEAPDGQEALEAAAQEPGRIDLLLTDVVMPGMPVREMAAAIAAARPEARILYMSGYPESVILHQGILDEGLVLLPKPFSPRELLSKVREMLVPREG